MVRTLRTRSARWAGCSGRMTTRGAGGAVQAQRPRWADEQLDIGAPGGGRRRAALISDFCNTKHSWLGTSRLWAADVTPCTVSRRPATCQSSL